MTSLLQFDSPPPRPQRLPVSTAAIDTALTAQLIVAWAGEAGEEKRLGWWRTDLVSEFGGEDLFRRLLPNTWEWAVLQAAREAARRTDAALRHKDHDADLVVSLFHFGVELDERIDERIATLKLESKPPVQSLPGLAMLTDPWSPTRFQNWIQQHPSVDANPTSIGRRLRGAPPTDLAVLTLQLVAALAPLANAYPLPHFRRER